jgi:hypothetical protein
MKKCLISHDRQKSEHCLFCNKKINPSYMEKLRAMVADVPKETKQKLLDLLHEGKTIGEATRECELDLQVSGEIIMQNIGKYEFLRKEAV